MAYFRKRGCKCADKKKCKCGAKWSFTVDLGRDPVTNERQQTTRSGFKTKGEAEKVCAELVTEFERGNISVTSAKDTLGAFMKEYLETTLKNEIEQNTYEGKVSFMNNHVIPKLGNLKLQKITPMHIQRFINELQESGLGVGSIWNIMKLVNQTLRTAHEWGFVTKNVTIHAKKPMYKKKNNQIWTKKEWDTFLEATKKSRFYPYYLIALNSGLRPGEIFALTWDDIDFKKKTIRVDKTVVNTKANGIEIKPSPKNDSSRRNVTIPEFVINYLKIYKLEQSPQRMNLVIPGIKSEIVYNSTINKALKADIKKAGVPSITPHELRHTHATYLISPKPFGLGISIKAVSERLGHANSTVTMNTYAHALENMQDAIAEALDDLNTETAKK